MTSTLIIMTAGIDKRDRVSVRGNRVVEPSGMLNFPECSLEVLEMQGGSRITNVYCGICEGPGFAQRRQGNRQVRQEARSPLKDRSPSYWI